MSLTEALGGFGKLWEPLGGCWKLWEALEGFSIRLGRLWKTLEGMGGLWEALVVFPGKGIGPGFSFSCRPLALDRTLNLSARRIFLYAFLHGFLNMR